ncbi:AAA family ATPase [Thiosocius teredinicola]|uniref:AAA family ATPase n=1 Tax=Thiosocius teredinicola TaxID=1973002 RepID=UPI000990F38B
MTRDKVSLRSVNNVKSLDIEFEYPDSRIIVVTGRNGVGKTTVIKSFGLPSEPNIFAKTSGEDALSGASQAAFELSEMKPFSFNFNPNLRAFDSKDSIPDAKEVVAELPIPYGSRFQQFAKVAKFDNDLKVNIASSDYEPATDLIGFLSEVYSSGKFEDLLATKIGTDEFYFILKDDDYYIREDHFSSGEFFLIQLYRLINSGADLILVDELDVALDAVAQVNLYAAIKPILQANNSRLIVVSHSLAFFSTVDEGGLYYLEKIGEEVSLEARSFGYVKSDLFGFRGYDRYILTEDAVLEGFIEFLIRHFSIDCHYRHITIGVGGVHQLKMIVEKNDDQQIFANSDKALCIVDGDVYPDLEAEYKGPTKVLCTHIDDLEKYLYLNREMLIGNDLLPDYPESNKEKKASKTYWKWLTQIKHVSVERLYQIIVESDGVDVEPLKKNIQRFVGQ